MSAYNDKAANRSAKRVAKAARTSSCIISQQVCTYVRQGYKAKQVVELMKDNHNTPVVLGWVKGLTGES